MNSEPEKQEIVLTFDLPAGYRDDGRLDVYLTEQIQNASRAKVQRGIREGRVSINETVVKRSSHRLQAGDHVTCRMLRPPPMEIYPEDIPLDIVYEDEDLLVVNKAAGMVVHPAYGHRTGTLVHALLHHVGIDSLSFDSKADEIGEDGKEGLSLVNASPRFGGDIAIRPGIVHRLDKDTSGLLVVARNDVAHAVLAKQFFDHSIHRRYHAIVWGVPEPSEGCLESWLGRDPRDRRRVTVVDSESGKRAVTHYRLLEAFGYTSLVEFRLETGRTHQIRVHAREMTHPVFGDPVYDGNHIRYGIRTGSRKAFYSNLFSALSRQALHAFSLGFKHPSTGEEMHFEAALPADMAHVVSRLREVDQF